MLWKLLVGDSTCYSPLCPVGEERRDNEPERRWRSKKINLDAKLSSDSIYENPSSKLSCFSSAWSKGIEDFKAGNKSTVQLVSQMTSKDGIFWLAKFSQVQDNSSCSHCHLNCQHLSPSPLQGIGEQDSPPDLPHLHPGLLDFRLDLANRWKPHPRWQCLKLYFSCVRILLCLFCF